MLPLQCYLQAGLIERWTVDVLERAQFNSQRRQNNVTKKNNSSPDKEDTAGGQKANMALTLIHMQGPLFLYIVGACLSLCVFLSEIGLAFYYLDHSTSGSQ